MANTYTQLHIQFVFAVKYHGSNSKSFSEFAKDTLVRLVILFRIFEAGQYVP